MNQNQKTDSINKNRKKYSNEFLLQELERYFNEFGKLPTTKGMDKTKGYPHTDIYRQRFGSFIKARQMVFGETSIDKIRFKEKMSREELIEELKKFKDKHGRIPLATDFKTSNKLVSYRLFQKEFNSFQEALIIAFGEDVVNENVRRYKWNRQDVLDSIMCFYNKYFELPNYNDFKNNKMLPSPDYMDNYLGGILRFMKEEDLIPKNATRVK